MRVLLKEGLVSVWIDGTPFIDAFAILGYVPFTGHWGFTASTGALSEGHYVTAISMSFPDGQGCVQ